MQLLGLFEEMKRRSCHMISLHLLKDERHGGWLKFIALYVRRLCLNSMQYSMEIQCNFSRISGLNLFSLHGKHE